LKVGDAFAKIHGLKTVVFAGVVQHKLVQPDIRIKIILFLNKYFITWQANKVKDMFS